MSQTSASGNGCSLEDCHTNLFALTDLEGIKWRKLTTESSTYSVDPIEDPVLKSFTNCIQSDILCVWRRVQNSGQDRTISVDQITSKKELWIFWYGREPDCLRGILAPELQEAETGDWGSGITYECRTLIFKALHNLIERCLLTKNFVRVGKWFVQPYHHVSSSARRNPHLSFRFSFFLHGVSQVCASIDVRQHPPLRRLNLHHLSQATQQGACVQVVCAPFGLAGVLTGHSFKEGQSSTQKLLEEWKHFYPLEEGHGLFGTSHSGGDTSKIPPLVEVVVAGVRMKYPSNFVLVTNEPEMETQTENFPANTEQSGDQIKSAANHGMGPDGRNGLTTPRGDMVLCSKIGQKVWQDCSISGAMQQSSRHHSSQCGDGEDASVIGTWELGEPVQKSNCGCANKRQKGGPNKPQSGSKHGKDKEAGRHWRSGSPFHRRSPYPDLGLQQEVDTLGVIKRPALPVQNKNTNLQRTQSFEQGSDSPNSCAPALAATHHQPTLNQIGGDPTMPTLSPHPPTKADLNSSLDSSTSLAGALHPTPTSESQDPLSGPMDKVKMEPLGLGVSIPSTPHLNQDIVKTEAINTWLESQKQVDVRSIKRPRLPSRSYDGVDEELTTEALYDFASLQNWLDCPVKRTKGEPRHDPTPNTAGTNHFGANKMGEEQSPSPQGPQVDPYEFSDDSSNNAAIPGNFSNKRGLRASFSGPSPFSKQEEEGRRNSDGFSFKEEKPSIDSSPGVLQNGTGPVTSIRDNFVPMVPATMDMPEKLFDTDESGDSDNDAFPVPPSPGSNRSMEEKCALGKSTLTTSQNTALNGPSSVELARMFPTPPSLENQHNALSPCTQTDAMMDTPCSENLALEARVYSARDENKDWSYVYKPSKVALFVGSSKYAPIELPSDRHVKRVDMTYKPSWQYPLPIVDKHQRPTPSQFPPVSRPDRLNLSDTTSPGVAAYPHSNQRTPMSYELQSPASNASSYMGAKGLNSVDPQGTNFDLPEAHSLVVNVMLADSVLNLFKDHNFDSCTLCVCNNNIRGADMGLYLPDKSADAQYKCTCGFSAVMNRKYGGYSGLFYEDEVDITGLRDNRLEARKTSLLSVMEEGEKCEDISPQVMLLLQGQYSSLFPSSSVLYNYHRKKPQALTYPGQPDAGINHLEIQDGCEACFIALEAGRQSVENCSSTSKLEDSQKTTCLHQWPFLQMTARVPIQSQDIVRHLKFLQPYLQDSLQKKKAWQTYFNVTGPLSWKDFHKRAESHKYAEKGQSEASDPQPVPPLLFGYEKEWLSAAPHAISHWDKLMLEPYGRPRDVAFVIVAPENEHVLSSSKCFFKELSTMYEMCHLGRHVPLSSKLRDGILRVGKSMASKLASQPVDKWFRHIGNNTVATKLRLYAQVMRHYLAPFLADQTLDKKSLFESSGKRPEPSPAPPTPENVSTPQGGNDDNKDDDDRDNDTRKTRSDPDADDGINDQPTVVVYVVDPFTYGHQWQDLNRLATLGLLRCFQEMLESLPDSLQHNVQLQVVPLQTVLDFREEPWSPTLKTLAMSVYSQSRRFLSHQILGRSLTGFGPASSAEQLLHSNMGQMNTYKLYSPPYVLAFSKQKQHTPKLHESISDVEDKAGVLLCAYCLSEDQRWLLAVCTDNGGELLETCTINIEIPNRNRRKKASARRVGLDKLWDFIVGVISTTNMAWRLVIGRFGRIGHGELKGWAGLLSKKNLARTTKRMQDMCGVCSLYSTGEAGPAILSACLVSMEIHNSINIMTDSIKSEDKPSNDCQLTTPKDASCTHILVFPISANAAPVANVTSAAIHDQDGMGAHMDIDMMDNLDTGLDDDFLWKDLEGEGLGDGLDIWDLPSPGGSGGGSPKNPSAPGSPQAAGGGGGASGLPNGPSKGGGASSFSAQDEVTHLLQQPLAMGLYISTAPTGPLPKWFWSACPHKEGLCPACFKAALHIHCQSVHQTQEDFYRRKKATHPLNSNLTTEVLRYVLELYNSLSWLTLDPVTNDRRSCLPAHFVVLMQLYNALNMYV